LLEGAVAPAELETRFVDRLIRITELCGDESWISMHVEVQGTKQIEFAQRMFVSNNRIFD
jgi:hypothetical protein